MGSLGGLSVDRLLAAEPMFSTCIPWLLTLALPFIGRLRLITERAFTIRLEISPVKVTTKR